LLKAEILNVLTSSKVFSFNPHILITTIIAHMDPPNDRTLANQITRIIENTKSFDECTQQDSAPSVYQTSLASRTPQETDFLESSNFFDATDFQTRSSCTDRAGR
jgi:hypothetical protein